MAIRNISMLITPMSHGYIMNEKIKKTFSKGRKVKLQMWSNVYTHTHTYIFHIVNCFIYLFISVFKAIHGANRFNFLGGLF
jgi:hypothetical protein